MREEFQDCVFATMILNGRVQCTALKDRYCDFGKCSFYKSNKEWMHTDLGVAKRKDGGRK